MEWWIWVLVAFVLLAFEFATTTLHIGLFAVGALTVAMLVGFGVDMPLSLQLLVFTGVSVVALVVVRPMLIKRMGLAKTPTVDSMLGEEATLLVDIPAGELGKATMRGTTWSARNIGESTLKRGERCTVDRVDGLVLYVRD